MTASAQERSEALLPIVAAARALVTELDVRAQQMDEAAAAAYRRADQASGDAAHEIAVQARRDLEPARARLAALEQAERAVSGERIRDDWTRQLADAEAAETAALGELDAHLAMIPLAVTAAKESIRLARQAEQQARQAQGQKLEFGAALAGETNVQRATHSRAQAVIDSSALLLSIERTSEF